MRRFPGSIIAVALLTGLAIRSVPPQTVAPANVTPQNQNHAERKVVSKVAPSYPELAKRIQLGGMVKLEVVVRQDGKVKSAKPLGGSPLLIQPTVDAVQRWRYEAGRAETTGVVQVIFDPTH
jgi:TonB family protein